MKNKIILTNKQYYNLFTFNTLANTNGKNAHMRKHPFKVTVYSNAIAKKLGLCPEKCIVINAAAQLHDYGKFFLPDSIILSPKKLSKIQFAIVTSHPIEAHKRLSVIKRVNEGIITSDDQKIPSINNIILMHHEKENLKGYLGLTPTQESRVLAAADAFEALTSSMKERKFSDEKSIQEALNIMEKDIGTHFDRKCVEALKEIISENNINTIDDLEKIKTDLPDITLFNGELSATKFLVSEEELTAYAEQMINSPREVEVAINQQTFKIKDRYEDYPKYIWRQENNTSIYQIFNKFDSKYNLAAEISQKKHVYTYDDFLINTGLTQSDIDKAGTFLKKTYDNKLCFSTLNHSENDFMEILNEFGSIIYSDLFYVKEDLNKLKISTDDFILTLKSLAILDKNNSIINIPAEKIFINLDLPEPALENFNNNLRHILENKFIPDIYPKREAIFKYYQKTKDQNIQIIFNNLTEEYSSILIPIIDYLRKEINCRGIPVKRSKEFEELVFSELNINQDQKNIIHNTIIWHYYFSDTFFLDEEHLKNNKNVINNLTLLKIKLLEVKNIISEDHFNQYLDLLIDIYNMRINDYSNINTNTSPNLIIIDILRNFISTNGLAPFVYSKDYKEFNNLKINIFRLFSKNPSFIHPDDQVFFNNILNN